MRPVAELRLGEERPEKFERGVFVCITLHVEINEGADFARPAQDRAQLRREMRYRIFGIGRIHLRIERGNFHRHVHDREELDVLAERIGPAAGPFRQSIEQIETARGVFVRFLFAHHCFAEQIDREPDPFLAPFAQHLHHVIRVAAGDELARHAGDVPAQDRRGEPGENASRAQARLHERDEAVAHAGKIFVKMLDDIAGAAERREHVHEAEHLHFERLVAHRESHHALIKAGLAENRFGIAVDQIENAPAPLLNLFLQRTHARY